MMEERLKNVVLGNIVSEKSTALNELGQYVFKILPNANKLEVRLAVEKMFNVRVENVRILNIQGKIKKVGSKTGKRKNKRKAYVRLKEGYEINFGNA